VNRGGGGGGGGGGGSGWVGQGRAEEEARHTNSRGMKEEEGVGGGGEGRGGRQRWRQGSPAAKVREVGVSRMILRWELCGCVGVLAACYWLVVFFAITVLMQVLSVGSMCD